MLDANGRIFAGETQHGGHFVAGGELEGVQDQSAVFSGDVVACEGAILGGSCQSRRNMNG